MGGDGGSVAMSIVLTIQSSENYQLYNTWKIKSKRSCCLPACFLTHHPSWRVLDRMNNKDVWCLKAGDVCCELKYLKVVLSK